ncbi:T9SS type A sorting domain-containing protein [Emticicia sp. TH156]|uniref:T9SS type A sorting domain-containing protein n=1 Tax=Emticicia sp. TH156 TaxID=2067454 RepID=UPI000C7711D6|nr:T9SS type A sorting domain-containing protein [Emticicia sp. TH156]PLK45170.1 hypothetical protein C0V77_08030 [Emticicia sp. TH156]
MRKNYFLSLLLLMFAFWNVEAKGRELSGSVPAVADSVNPLNTSTNLVKTYVPGSGSQLDVGWKTNNTESVKYQIAFSTDGVNFNYFTTEAFTTYGAYHFNGLIPNKKYWFSVRAAKDTLYAHTRFATCATDSIRTGVPNDSLHRYSCWSPLFAVTTMQELPVAPSIVGVADGWTQTTATIVFKDVSDNENKFIIKRSMNDGPWTDVAFINTPDSTGKEYNVTYVDNTLMQNSKVQYQVASWNRTGFSPTATFGPVFFTLPYPPQAPILLISPYQTLNEVRLEWTNRDPIVWDFQVERSVNNTDWSIIATGVPAYAPFYNDLDAWEGTTYYYRVRARNRGGLGEASIPLKVTTPARVGPPAPLGLKGKSITPNRVDLTWKNPTFGPYEIPKQILVYRSATGAGEGYTQLATLAPSDTSYTDNTTLPKVTYWYKVMASNDQGPSPYSNIVSLLTLGPPTAPSGLVSEKSVDNLGYNNIKIKWVDNSNDEEFFVLERAQNNTFTIDLTIMKVLANKTDVLSIPIEEGVTYYFRVKSTNQYGESSYSSVSSVETVYTMAPNKPYALKATASSATKVALKWGDDSNKEETFVVERSVDGTAFTGLVILGRNTTSYTDSTVTANKKFWYRVKAVNNKGNSDYSDVASVTTPAASVAVVAVAAVSTSTADNWVVYPNPTNDAVKLVIPEAMQNNAVVITVIDKMNREVIKTKIDARQKEHILDLSNFVEGTYTISIRTADKQVTKRVYKY